MRLLLNLRCCGNHSIISSVLISAILSSQALAQPVAAKAQKIDAVKDLIRDRPATTVQEWLSQTSPPSQAPIQVTGVRVNPTDAELEVILQTVSSTQLQTVRRVEGNTLPIRSFLGF